MAAELTASMKLQLDDLLSAPLKKVEELLKRIGEIGKVASIEKLTASMQPLREGANLAQTVIEKVTGIGAAAAEAIAPIAEMNRTIAAAAEGASAATDAAEAVSRVGAAAVESTGKMEILLSRMKAMGSAALGAGGSFIGGVPGLVRETGGRVRELGASASEFGGAALGAGAAGFGIYEPVHAAAEYDQLLRQIAITEGLSGAAVGPELARLNALFTTDANKNGQKSAGIAEAYLDLLGQGTNRNLLDKVIGLHTMAATAYGIAPEVLGNVSGALLNNFGIDDKSFGGALASIAVAAKSGRFKVADFSGELANVAGSFTGIGLTGRSGVDEVNAVLETVMKNVGLPSSAAASMVQLIQQMHSSREDKRFDKLLHKNLPKYLENERAHGVNDLDAFLNLIHQRTKGMSSEQMTGFIAQILPQVESQRALVGLLVHHAEFKALQAKLGTVGQDTLERDAATALAGMGPNVARTTEQVTELNRNIGTGLYPVLLKINGLLKGLNTGYTAGDAATHGGLSTGIAAVGGTVAVGVGLNLVAKALGMARAGFMVFSPLVSRLGLDTAFLAGRIVLLNLGFEAIAGSAIASAAVFGGILLAVAALGLAAYELYKHWDVVAKWFKGLWDGILNTINAAVQALHDFNGATPNVTGQGGGRGSVHGPQTAPKIDLHLHVTTDHPNTKVAVTDTRVTSAPNRGLVLGRP